MSTPSSHPPIVMFTTGADGNVAASRVSFTPLTDLRMQDLFSAGVIAWSTRFKFPYISTYTNDVWATQILMGEQIVMLYVCDYVPWNVPIALSYTDGQATISHCQSEGSLGTNCVISGRGNDGKTTASVNYRTRVSAKEMGFDKVFLAKYSPNPAHAIDLDASGDDNHASAVRTSIYLGFVDLEKRHITRAPMSNIHENGKLCLVPSSSANTITPRPDTIFAELVRSHGNLDLIVNRFTDPLYFVPIPDTEDEEGTPWLDMRTRTPGARASTMAMSIPDFWKAFQGQIDEFLTLKKSKK